MVRSSPARRGFGEKTLVRYSGWLVVVLCSVLSAEARAQEQETLSFEQAVQIARARAREAVRAREDLLLVDVQHRAAVSAILPRVDVTLRAGEIFAGPGVLETRTQSGFDFEIDPVTLQPTRVLRPGTVLRYGPFEDYPTGSYSNPAFALEVTGQQLIYDGGRWWTAIARVKDMEANLQAAQRAVENDLRARVAERFYGLERETRATEILEAQLSVGEAQLERARAMVQAGRSKLNDVATAERNVSEDRINLARRRLALDQARRALNLELGRQAHLPVQLVLSAEVKSATVSTAGLGLGDADELLAIALERRPELARLDAERRSAEKAVTIARADYYPSLALGATYRRQSRRPDRVFGDPTENYYAGLDLIMRWNVFEGRATGARVEEQEIALRKLDTDREDLVRRIEGEVQDRLQTMRVQLEVHRLARDSVRSASEAVRLARGLFEQGLGTALELRDAELKYSQAQLVAVEARLEVEIAREALRRAIGGDPAEVR